MTQIDPSFTESNKRNSNLSRVATLIFGAALVVLAFYLFLAWQLDAWQMYVLVGVIAIFTVDNFLAMRMIRAGRPDTGSWMILGGLLAVFPVATLFVAGVGVIFGFVLVVLTLSVANLMLPHDQARRAILASVMVGLLTALLELLPLDYRLTVPQIQAFVPAVIVIIVAVILFFAIRRSGGNLTNYWHKSIRNRLTVIVVGAAILPVLAISIFLGVITYFQIRDALTKSTFDRLAAIEAIKTTQLASYMSERQDDMVTLRETAAALRQEAIAKLEAVNNLKARSLNTSFADWDADVRDVASDPGVVLGMDDLASGFREVGAAYVRSLYLGQEEAEHAGDDSGYSAAHLEQHGFFAGYIGIHGYEDAYLIDAAGNVVYSVNKNDVFGTNLSAGLYRESNLASLYQSLKNTPAGESVVVDAAFLLDRYVMFIGTPIYDGNVLVGMLVYQLSLADINIIIQDRAGLTASAETFLISKTGEQIELRSDRIIKNGLIGDPKPGDDSERALAGESDVEFRVGSTGEYEISVFAPLDLPGLNWAIVTTSSVSEVFVPHLEGRVGDFFTEFQNNYGFYDVFLISPDGFIFYSVTKEADFQTNILTGKYSDSNLAALVNEILKSKSYEFVDFAYYAPSGDTPAAFFGIPQVSVDGEVEMIMVAQISIDDINQIMNEASGLGESGESYIIGQDFLGRMDSRFIEQFGVETTVLNPDFAVDTEAVRSALAGESGQDTIIDYRGLPVLSVWTPFYINESDASQPEAQAWAVLTEIDESEALSPINQLARGMGAIIGLAALAIGVLAVFVGTRFAVGFVTPILNLTEIATQVAGGNLDLRLATDSEDEIGTLTTTFNNMTAQLQDTMEGLEQRVAERTQDLATVARISTVTATIREPFEMLSNMVHLTQRGFGLYHAHVFTYHKDTDELKIVACGYKEGDEHEGTHGTTSIPVTQEQSLVARAARTRKPIIVNDVRSDPGWLPNPLLPDTHAELAVPMIVGDELLGVLDVQADHVGAFSEESANIQMTLASQVATALQNAQAYTRAQKQAELESLVNVIGQRIQRTTSIEDTLQTAIRELGTAIGATRVRASIRSASEVAATQPASPAEPAASVAADEPSHRK